MIPPPCTTTVVLVNKKLQPPHKIGVPVTQFNDESVCGNFFAERRLGLGALDKSHSTEIKFDTLVRELRHRGTISFHYKIHLYRCIWGVCGPGLVNGGAL